MTPLARSVADFVAAWNTADEARRRALLEASFAADGTYVDPAVRLVGRAALEAHCARLAAERPGAVIVATSAVDEHGGGGCFTWRVVGPDGTTLREGLDVVATDATGRLARVVGFFGDYRSPLTQR